MDTDESSSAIANHILSKEDLEKIPNDVRAKYEIFFSDFIEIKALYETQKTNLGE